MSRLYLSNLKEYISSQIGNTYKIADRKILINFKPLLQDNFGEDNDCTLTSITSIINYLKNNTVDVNKIYPEVESIAKKYFYNGKSLGTIPIFIKKIYSESLNKFGITMKTNSGYLKNVGFNFQTIKSLINKNKPIILSIMNDGRDYYKNHSITVIGYIEYKNNNNDSVQLIVIYDNWHDTYSYIDYKKLNSICNIVY